MSKAKIRLMRWYDKFCRFIGLGCGYCGGEVNLLANGQTVCATCKRRA